jgi:hypothetical protein
MAQPWTHARIATVLLFLAAPAFAQNTVRLPAEDNVLSAAPAAMFSIGKDEGQDWELLARVTQVGFDSKDNLYVFDAGTSRLLVFDARGAFVRQIGKKGEGPGEFANAFGFALLSDGTIAVADNGNYHLFAPDGTFKRTAFRPSSGGTIMIAAGGLMGVLHDNILIRGRSPIPGFRGEPVSPDGTVKVPIQLDALGETVTRTTLYEITRTAPKVEQQQMGPRGGFVMTRSQAKVFEPQIHLTTIPDAAVIAHETTYRVHVVDANGRITRTLERPFPARRVTRRDQDRAREFERERMRTTPMPSVTFSGGGGNVTRSGGARMSDQEIDEQLKNLVFAEEIALIRRVLGDPSGRIWVERTADDPYADGPIDILDAASARYIGTLRNQRLPAAISASGRAAWIVKDELDVQRVEVKQLPASWR